MAVIAADAAGSTGEAAGIADAAGLNAGAAEGADTTADIMAGTRPNGGHN